MKESLSNDKRIAKNTVFLYIRMLFSLVVGLYTSRVVLQTLGASDYGIYNVVGGFVSMFLFINATMTIGTERFLAYELGKGDLSKISNVFSNAIYVHAIIALLFVCLAETLGLWFVSYKMQIPVGRNDAALWVFHFSVFTAVLQVLQVPFNASIVAHEKMKAYAYLSIYDSIIKLLILYFLVIMNSDKLVIYAFFLMLAQFSTSLFYFIYSRFAFDECKRIVGIDKRLLKNMLNFSGWSMIGMLGTTCQGQGVNVLLNLFFGTIVNASRGIAYQVNNVLLMFANNFQMAVTPQIIKYYATGELSKMTNLVFVSAKISALLILLLMMPLMVATDFVLSVWLGDYPQYAPLFLKIICIQTFMQVVIRPVVFVTHAVGKTKMPNLTGGLLVLLALPFCWIAYRLGANPYVVLLVSIVPWLFEEFFDLFFAERYAKFPMKKFYLEVYCIYIVIGIVDYFALAYIYQQLSCNIYLKFIGICILSTLLLMLSTYFLALKNTERKVLNNYIHFKKNDKRD